ncbi:MAG TPA: anti-phage protein KwaB [Oxalicibacterium sp.]|uniref:anti-phage protein KwaB n=1 Tax=Oxalicibacterium sp. TaxID=2766525 RepID=UPI002BCB9960|nr:anti-phage protein KwaB [Oxalicibacterium sp.]HWU97028.1 anti-phage protein KwaB [Oxalicibacterium sp.]
MSLDALRTKISDVISDEACSAEFYFLLDDNNGQISIKRADIDQNTVNELAQNFIEAISGTVLLNDELSLLNISSADDRANAIYQYDLPEVPAQIQHLATILQRDDFEVFSFEADDLAHLKGILIILGHGQQQLALYKHQYPVALLKRDSAFSLVRIRNQNRLVKLEDDVLRINSKFEFIRIDNEYFIVDIKTLERFFGFHDAIRNIATQGIANIDQAQLVVDTLALTARLDDISFSRKLVRAAKASPVLGVIPNAQVIAFVDSHPALRGKFRLSDDGSKLKLDTKVSQDLFLKLLNDDFLQSELTKRYYASLAKDNLEAEANP